MLEFVGLLALAALLWKPVWHFYRFIATDENDPGHKAAIRAHFAALWDLVGPEGLDVGDPTPKPEPEPKPTPGETTKPAPRLNKTTS